MPRDVFEAMSETSGGILHRRACLDGQDDDERLEGSHPCFLLGTLEFRSPSVSSALILEPTGKRVAGVEEFRRIGFLCYPFSELWSEDEEEISIDLV